jgi:exportin-1
VLRNVDFIIKVNTRVAEAVGFIYLSYLSRIFDDLLKMYRLYSHSISECAKIHSYDSITKQMRGVRRDILRLIQTYIQKTVDLNIFAQQFLPKLQGLIEDYHQSEPNARDPEVLMLFATMLDKMGGHIEKSLLHILIHLCDPTLEMIRNDMVSYPDFRDSLFKLVQNIVKNCTQGFFSLDYDKF